MKANSQNFIHGEAHKTRLYKIWSGMKERCYRVNHNHYGRYGGRGIIVCDTWKSNYLAFKEWAMSNGYADDLTLDRINIDGNYEPSNCRWIPLSEQPKNKSDNRIVEYKGKKYILSELAKMAGMNHSTLTYRINRGWDIQKAVEMPIRARTHGYRTSKGYS